MAYLKAQEMLRDALSAERQELVSDRSFATGGPSHRSFANPRSHRSARHEALSRRESGWVRREMRKVVSTMQLASPAGPRGGGAAEFEQRRLSISALQQACERHSDFERRMAASITEMQDNYPFVSQAVETSFAAKLVLHTQRSVVAALQHHGELLIAQRSTTAS